MSGIPTWQAATTYVPGSIVVPSSSAPVTQPQPANADFETGDLTGWTATGSGTWANSSTTPYIGTHCVLKSGSGYGTLTSTTLLPVQPGQAPTATAYFKLTNAGADDQGVQVQLIFLDAIGSPIGSPTVGNSIIGVGGVWKPSVASGVAPSGATHFVVALYGNTGTHGGTLEADQISVTYAYQVANPGIVYKATQAAPGKSASSEPIWPGVVGVPITDNQVTWEGEYATRLVWQASALLQSGATEPTWPTQIGAAVHDGTIDWIGRSAQITDPNCPQSKIVAIGAGKIFAADNDIVRYCATVNPLDWTTPNDAGYLPTGLQTYGSNPVAAMGLYRSNLVVYNAEGFQMWQLDPDPANIALLDALPVASTYNRALAPTANDLFFLSSQGVRSMGISSAGVNLEAGDVGMPIDVLVKDAIRVSKANGNDILSTYVPSFGQYFLAFPNYPAPPLSLSGHLADMTTGSPVSFQYVGAGGVAPYVFAITAGALPAGLSMNSAGLVTGTRTTIGSYSWTVNCTDANASVVTLPDASSTFAPRMALFDGSGDYLTAPFAAPIIATGDFTVEARISVSGTAQYGIISGRNSNIRGWALQVSGNVMGVRMSMNTGSIDGANNMTGGTIPINTLTHVAWTRLGNLFTLWINGVSSATYTNAGYIDEPGVDHLAIGTSFAAMGENSLNGYIDWCALTIGKCRYTAPFAPPFSAAQVAGASSALDFNEPVGSTTFADIGSKGLIWTTVGNVIIANYPY